MRPIRSSVASLLEGARRVPSRLKFAAVPSAQLEARVRAELPAEVLLEFDIESDPPERLCDFVGVPRACASWATSMRTEPSTETPSPTLPMRAPSSTPAPVSASPPSWRSRTSSAGVGVLPKGAGGVPRPGQRGIGAQQRPALGRTLPEGAVNVRTPPVAAARGFVKPSAKRPLATPDYVSRCHRGCPTIAK